MATKQSPKINGKIPKSVHVGYKGLRGRRDSTSADRYIDIDVSDHRMASRWEAAAGLCGPATSQLSEAYNFLMKSTPSTLPPLWEPSHYWRQQLLLRTYSRLQRNESLHCSLDCGRFHWLHKCPIFVSVLTKVGVCRNAKIQRGEIFRDVLACTQLLSSFW